jgi:signal peptidase I
MRAPALTEDASPRGSGRSALWLGGIRRGGQALAVLVFPALLALLMLRYLVPPAGSGARGLIALLGHRYTLFFGVALFFLFSALTRYWLRRLAPSPREETRAPAVPLRALASKRRREAIAVLATVLVAAGVALVFRGWVARPYRVIGASMLPTLQPDDLLAGKKTAYGRDDGRLPLRGEVVVFGSSALATDLPGADLPDVLVKRVIGLPGDSVAMRGGAPVINDWAVPTCDAGEYLYVATDGRSMHGQLHLEFLDEHTYLTVHAMGAPFAEAYRVQPGEVFVLGDNRGNSIDSRAFHGGHGGGVPLASIEARARWFLTGTHRSGDVDLGRLFRPLDTLQTRLRLEGLETRRLEEGMARCLATRPAETRPPPHREPTATRTL